MAQRILVGAGYIVLAAASGVEALATYEWSPGEIHLVLTDVVMPEMSGRIFADRLKDVRPGIKVLYMSGYTDDAIVHHGILDAGTHFVEKPIVRAELLWMVRQVLDKKE